MQNKNQWVPVPTPVMGVSNTNVPGSTGNLPASDGIILPAFVRDQTGASGGTASGAYTSDWFQNPAAKGVRVFVKIATGAATGTTTVKLQVQNPADPTGSYDLPGATTAALAGNTTGAVLVVYPTITASTGVAAQQHLGSRWRVVATQALAPATFSVGADYLL